MTGPNSQDSFSTAQAQAHGPDAARDLHREQLSAMMDGVLSDDESRFLLRRMQHDAELAGSWERWQLYGDAMRGCAGRVVPADFSRRVSQAIEADAAIDTGDATVPLQMAEAVGQAPRIAAGSARPVTSRPLLRWGGGAALAASVAFAAIVGLRPTTGPVPVPGAEASLAGAATGETSSTGAGATRAVASETGSAVIVAAESEASPVQPAGDSPSTTAAAATALAAAPPAQAPVRSASARPAASAPAPVAAQPSPLVLAAQPLQTATPRVPDLGDEDLPLTPKPWPRSLLPVQDGVMVGYGHGDGRALILGRPAAQPPQSASPQVLPHAFMGEHAPSNTSEDTGTGGADAPSP